MRTMLKSKIHRARVTDANIDYEGSITIGQELMEAADIFPFDQDEIARFPVLVMKTITSRFTAGIPADAVKKEQPFVLPADFDARDLRGKFGAMAAA